MNIVHVIPALDRACGGPVVALAGLVKAQAKLGQRIHVVVGTDRMGVQVQEEMESVGVQVAMANSSRTEVYRCLQFNVAMNRALASADVVHIHGLWGYAQTAGATQAMLRGIPYIIRPCGMLDAWSLSQNHALKRVHLAVITRRLLNKAALLHATTERERAEILKHAFCPPVSVVPNGVDEEAFASSNYPLATELKNLRDSSRILLFLGRVHSKKGLDVLIPAIAKAQTQSAVLAIVGPREPTHYEAIRRVVCQLGIEERVKFLDPLYGEARFAAYSAADLFLLPSKQENFGITVAEAMARGVPVIVSPDVALSDDVAKSHAGLVIPRDSERWAKAIDELLTHDELRWAMAAAGRKAAEENFQWAGIAERWHDLYASLLAPAARDS